MGIYLSFELQKKKSCKILMDINITRCGNDNFITFSEYLINISGLSYTSHPSKTKINMYM